MKTISKLSLGALLLAASMNLTCKGQTAPPVQPEELLCDLLARAGEAAVTDGDFASKYWELRQYRWVYRDPWAKGSPRAVRVGFLTDAEKKRQDMRRAFYMSASRGLPCTVRFPLREGERAGILRLALAGYRLRESRGRSLEISLIAGDRKIPLTKGMSLGPSLPEERWRDLAVELPRIEGSPVSLEFCFRTESPGTEHLFLGNPRIWGMGPVKRRGPNVLFICVDALRGDAVRTLSGLYDITPSMDAVARDGWGFAEHFVNANWTRPSTMAMLTGALASSTGVKIFGSARTGVWDFIVHREEKDFFYGRSGILPVTTLFKQRGYVTKAVGQNPFLMEYSGIGIDLDFDEFSEYETLVRDTADVTEEAVNWLGAEGGKPFFLYINYNAPHNAYVPPPRYREIVERRNPGLDPVFRNYLGEVAYTDDYLGRVIAALRRLGLYDDTIIVITSDHGEIFSPDHAVSPYTDVPSLHTHGQTHYDEELRVPLIIKPAGGAEPLTVKAQTRSIDVVPTILELAGWPVPAFVQGRSLIPLTRGEEKEERIVYCEGKRMYSVRSGGCKYAERFYGFGFLPEHWGGDSVREYAELFDLRNDPGERENLAGRSSKLEGRMKALLESARFQQPENRLTLRGSGISGRIRTEYGFFYGMKAEGVDSRALRVSRREYAFRLASGGSLVFQTIPAGARLSVRFDREERFLAGPWLLPLADRVSGGYRLDLARPGVTGVPREDLIPSAGKGVFCWRTPGESALREMRGGRALSGDVTRLLRQWGYIQGQEKR